MQEFCFPKICFPPDSLDWVVHSHHAPVSEDKLEDFFDKGHFCPSGLEYSVQIMTQRHQLSSINYRIYWTVPIQIVQSKLETYRKTPHQ